MEGLCGLFSCLRWSGFFPPFFILGVALGFAPSMFFCDICRIGLWRSGSFVLFTLFAGRKLFLPFRLLLPPAPTTSPCAVTSSEVTHPSSPSSSSFLPSEGRGEEGESWDAPCASSVGLPLLPLDMCPARGVEVPLDAFLVHAGSSGTSAPSGVGDSGAARSHQIPVPLRSFLGCPSSLITARSARC